MMRDISVTMIVGYQAVGPTENKWNQGGGDGDNYHPYLYENVQR